MFIKPKFEYIADTLLLSVTIFWGSTFIIVKKSIEIMPTFAFLSIRFWIASIMLIIIFFPKIKKINKHIMKDGILLGSMLFLAYSFQTVALEYSKSSVVGFLTGLNVAIVPVLSAIVLNKIPPVYSWVGVALSLIGMGLLSLNNNFSISFGNLLAIMGALFVSIHILMTDRFSRKYDTYLLTAIQITTVAVLSTLISLAKEPYIIPRHIDKYLIFSFIMTSFFATVYAFIIQTTAQKYTTPTKTSLIFTAEPVMAGVFGYIFGNEVLSLRGYAGAAAIIIGILIAEIAPIIRTKK